MTEASSSANQSSEKYDIERDGNTLVINDELHIQLFVDTVDWEGVEPTEYEWLDEGAFALRDKETQAGVQVVMREDQGGSDE